MRPEFGPALVHALPLSVVPFVQFHAIFQWPDKRSQFTTRHNWRSMPIMQCANYVVGTDAWWAGGVTNWLRPSRREKSSPLQTCHFSVQNPTDISSTGKTFACCLALIRSFGKIRRQGFNSCYRRPVSISTLAQNGCCRSALVRASSRMVSICGRMFSLMSRNRLTLMEMRWSKSTTSGER